MIFVTVNAKCSNNDGNHYDEKQPTVETQIDQQNHATEHMMGLNHPTFNELQSTTEMESPDKIPWFEITKFLNYESQKLLLVVDVHERIFESIQDHGSTRARSNKSSQSEIIPVLGNKKRSFKT